MIALIAAMTPDHVIGNKGKIPWSIKGEQIRFRELTMGHAIIMGRKTFESIGRALPGRQNIVVTRNPNYIASDITVAPDLQEAIVMAGMKRNAFIIGGAELYREGLELAERLYLTIIHGKYEGDTLFPQFSLEDWEEIDRKYVSVLYTEYTYKRRQYGRHQDSGHKSRA